MKASKVQFLVVLIVVSMQSYALPCFAQVSKPDSGVYGVIPRFQENLRWIRGEIDSLRKEYPLPTANKKSISATLVLDESLLGKWKNRCVEAYDERSRVPPGYTGTGNPGRPRISRNGSCMDLKRFPRGYMKLAGAAACASDGSFRLPLAPGSYEVFVGQSRYLAAASGNPWHQLVIVEPHRWQRLSEPQRGGRGAKCSTDAQCMRGYSCLSPKAAGFSPPFLGFPLLDHSKTCEGPVMAPQPAYDSGVRGRSGSPGNGCVGTVPLYGLPTGGQCVEAFREGSSEMVTCGGCLADGSFVLPLPPGRYTLEFQSGQNRERRSVEVRKGQWTEVYALGGKPGSIRPRNCSAP